MIFLTLSFLLYFAPALLATSRRAPNAIAIWLTNFFVGWTIIGWIITLIWALNTPATIYAVPIRAASPDAAPTAAPFGDRVYAASPGADVNSAWASVAPAAASRTCVACNRSMPIDARFCPACGSVESRLG